MSWRQLRERVTKSETGENIGAPLHEQFESHEDRLRRKEDYRKKANFDSRFGSKAFSPHTIEKRSFLMRYPRVTLGIGCFITLWTVYGEFFKHFASSKEELSPEGLERTEKLEKLGEVYLWWMDPNYYLQRGNYAVEKKLVKDD